MEVKREVIQIETFFKYAEEGEGKRLESIERLVRVDGEVVQRQQMSPLMYRLDNSPIRHFLSWIKGDGRRDKKPEDYWKEVRASVDDRKKLASWLNRPSKSCEEYAEGSPSKGITLTEVDRRLVQKMINAALKQHLKTQLKMVIPALQIVRVHEPSCKESKVAPTGKSPTKSNEMPLLSEDFVWDDEIYMLDDAEEEKAYQNRHTHYRNHPALSETEKVRQILERMHQVLEDGVSSLRELERQHLTRKLLQDQF